MKLNYRYALSLFAGLVLATNVTAQSQNASDKVDGWRKAREEYLSQLRAKEQVGGRLDGLQKELDRLSDRRVFLERESTYVRSKSDTAAKQLQLANSNQVATEIEKWQKEASAWAERVKAVETETAQIDAQIEAKLGELRKLASEGGSKVLTTGEPIQIFVVEDESFNSVYQIREGGYIVLPRIGRVQVAGKDLPDAEKTIKEALEASQLRQATVMVERTVETYSAGSANVVYLAGEFKQTGPLLLPAGYSPTITTIFIRSGGTKDSGDLTRVKLLRLAEGKSLVEEVNVQAILDGAGLTPDVSVQPGDIVVVPAFANRVYVTGNVKSAGIVQLPIDEELTAYAAILRSGGFARFAKKSGVYVLRNGGNGEKFRIPVSIKSVQSGKQPDVVLQSNDIIVVPESFFSF
ncbi:MAG TPA: polysaccharide biosynthesis/export family protein [Verrucomicrobiae bacterium]